MLGQKLIEHSIITEEMLDQALNIQINSGGRLGDILVSIGATTPYALYQTIAEQAGLPFINLLTDNWERSALDATYTHAYAQKRLVPMGKIAGSKVMRIATSEPFDPAVKQFCYEHYPEGVEMHITSPLDIRRTIEQQFSGELTDDSLHTLAELMPERSAHYRLSGAQKLLLLALFGAFGTYCYMDGYQAAAMTLFTAHVFYFITMTFKMLVFLAGLLPVHYDKPALPLDHKNLPSFTLLIPLYKERAVLPKLLNGLSKLDYPKHKLDIKLVLEADDEDTYQAATQMKPSYQFDIIRVPLSEPRTKPKACNYAMAFAKGDIITIYDAEDIPNSDQLRKVAEMFDAAPENVTTIQAKLRYYNADKNLLTRFFDIEYAILFEHLLAGLERLHIPIPLGGTSNHISAERFREMGHWDPFNVTEDADLGIRFAGAGFKTQMVQSTTMEEAPVRLGAWMRQRSRWIKGHLQTWLVHSRRPLRLLRTIGPHGFLGFNLFMGIPYILYLTTPFVVLLTYLWGSHGLFDDAMPYSLVDLMSANLLMFLGFNWLQAFWVYRHKRASLQMLCAIFFFPAYWLLHIVTSFKSLWQLIFRPFYWEKTEHGQSA